MCDNVMWFGKDMIVAVRRDSTPTPLSDITKAANHVEDRIPGIPFGKEDVYTFPTLDAARLVRTAMLGRLQRHGPRGEVRVRREGTSIIVARFGMSKVERE